MKLKGLYFSLLCVICICIIVVSTVKADSTTIQIEEQEQDYTFKTDPNTFIKEGMNYYDIFGKPYTGKLYQFLLGMVIELDIQNGNAISQKICKDKECRIVKTGTIEGIISETDENGQLKDGIIQISSLKLSDHITRLGYDGKFINGVPDGLHKTYDKNNTLAEENMFQMGIIQWQKRYRTDSNGTQKRNEHYYLGKGIFLDREYINNQIVSEKKYLNDFYSGKNIQRKQYVDGHKIFEINYNEDGSATLVDQKNISYPLKANKRYRITYENTESDKFYSKHFEVPEWETEIPHFPKLHNIVSGHRVVCSLAFPRKENAPLELNNIPEYEMNGCYKDFKSNSEPFPDIKLNEEDMKLLYQNPKQFFNQNTYELDMSEINLDISKIKLDLNDMGNSLKKLMAKAIGSGLSQLSNNLIAEANTQTK